MHLKDAQGMANSVDPDQTAPWEKLDLGIHCLLRPVCLKSCEPRHDKINKMRVHPAKTQISLGIRPV